MSHTDTNDTIAGDRDVRRETAEDARRAADRLGADARGAAREAGARAQEEATHQAERAKTGAASEMSGIADALRTAAREMRSGSPQERTFGQIAETLAGASDALRERDLGELAGEVSDFARRNPIGFLGGAALAGFAATRFAQASTAPRGDAVASDDTDDGEGPVLAASPQFAPTDATRAARPGHEAGDVATGPSVVPAQPKAPGDQ